MDVAVFSFASAVDIFGGAYILFRLCGPAPPGPRGFPPPAAPDDPDDGNSWLAAAALPWLPSSLPEAASVFRRLFAGLTGCALFTPASLQPPHPARPRASINLL